MATYMIQINERTSLGKAVIALLHSVPQVVIFEDQTEKVEKKSELYKNLDNAFHDVRLMIDGKKRKKSAEELLYELQNEL